MYIVKLDQEFTDNSLPFLYPDAIMNKGSLFLFDFTNKNCWDPSTAITNNAVIKNLVEGAPTAKLNINSSTDFSFIKNKGFKYADDKNTISSNILVGNGTDLFQSENDFAISIWVTAPTPQVSLNQAASRLFSKQKDYNSDNGKNNKGLVINLESNSNQSTTTSRFGSKIGGSPDATNLNINLSRVTGLFNLTVAKVGSTVYMYEGGILKGSYAYTSSFVNASPIQIGRPLDGISGGLFSAANTLIGATFHRIYAEDLTLSKRKIEDLVSAEYNQNYSKFAA